MNYDDYPLLTPHGTPSVSVTCTLANTDYAAASVAPRGATFVCVYSAAVVIVAMGEATSSTVGLAVPASFPVFLQIDASAATDALNTIHVQSPTAGAVVRLTYLFE